MVHAPLPFFSPLRHTPQPPDFFPDLRSMQLSGIAAELSPALRKNPPRRRTLLPDYRLSPRFVELAKGFEPPTL